MILLVPITLWMAIAFVLGLVLSSGKKGALIAITISFFIAYHISTYDIMSIGLKIIPLLPAIMIGAYFGGLIDSRFARKKVEIG